MSRNDFLKKRIAEMRHNIFPLDRIISLEMVYSIFFSYYSEEPNKGVFFRDRKYQRLREGYIGLFVAASLQHSSGKRYFMYFPEKDDNDFYVMRQATENQFDTFEFDAKEFTDYSPSFDEFTEKKIAPRIETYNIAIATYRNIGATEVKCLIDLLQKENTPRQIWLMGAATPNDENQDISRVSIIGKEGVAYDEVINLNDWIDKTKPGQVFHDTFRFKYPPRPQLL